MPVQILHRTLLAHMAGLAKTSPSNKLRSHHLKPKQPTFFDGPPDLTSLLHEPVTNMPMHLDPHARFPHHAHLGNHTQEPERTSPCFAARPPFTHPPSRSGSSKAVEQLEGISALPSSHDSTFPPSVSPALLVLLFRFEGSLASTSHSIVHSFVPFSFKALLIGPCTPSIYLSTYYDFLFLNDTHDEGDAPKRPIGVRAYGRRGAS